MTNNKLIAEFIGFYACTDPNHAHDRCYDIRSVSKYKFTEAGYRKSNEMKFESSWDWLMPVVEKVEKIEGVRVIIKGSRCRILAGKKVFSCHTISKLNSMYRVVVEFIEWYNNQPKNP